MKKILTLVIGVLMFGVNAFAAGDLVVGGNASVAGRANIAGIVTIGTTTIASVNGVLVVTGPSSTQVKLDVDGAVRASQGTMLYSCPSVLSSCGSSCVGQVTTATTCSYTVWLPFGGCQETTGTANCTFIGRLLIP